MTFRQILGIGAVLLSIAALLAWLPWANVAKEPSAAQGASGDRVVVDKISYRFSGPRRGDLVVFRDPLDKSHNFIKRVSEVAGGKVRLDAGDAGIDPPPPSTGSGM